MPGRRPARLGGVGVSLLLPDGHEREPRPAQDLDEDADADKQVEDREDLQPAVVEYEDRIGDARRRQRRQ
jgi:hypothetical protein